MKLILIIALVLTSCVAKKNTMKCDAYNGAHSKMKYKKWYKR